MGYGPWDSKDPDMTERLNNNNNDTTLFLILISRKLRDDRQGFSSCSDEISEPQFPHLFKGRLLIHLNRAEDQMQKCMQNLRT